MRTQVRTLLTSLPRPSPLWGTATVAALVSGFVAGCLRTRGLDAGLGIEPEEIRLIAQEQDALRRVTTLTACGASPAEIFDAVAGEMGRVVNAENMIMCRFQPDGTCLVVASWSAHGEGLQILPVGCTFKVYPDCVSAGILRTGRPVRMNYTTAQRQRIYRGSPAARELGIRSGVGCPIVVEGRLWGMLVTYFATARPRTEVEQRMLGFMELVATAIANAEGRAELMASRARVVAAADASRRRIERDLHDGAQQRIVRLVLAARAAAEAAAPGQDELRAHLSELAEELTGTLDDLREISHGLHPAILSRGGLGLALSALARRSAVPAELDLSLDGRIADSVEVAVYYVVSEALTNAAKQAQATLVRVGARVDDGPDGRVLVVTVRDDGVGGADPGRGQGLIGLGDRVEALAGRFDVASPVGEGTTLTARIPIDADGSSGPPGDG